MEYGEAISSVAAQKALAIACLKVAGGPVDLRTIAEESVEGYRVCVVDGEDAAEGGISAVHRTLIADFEVRVRAQLATRQAD
jgi:hypothetical protein